jgi:NADPH:quinone reductase
MERKAVASHMTEGWIIDDYGQPEDLRLAELSVPVPGSNEILVEVEAASLNPLDLKLMQGTMRQFMPVVFPFVPGSDICGTVVALGDEVEDYQPGDRVVGMTPSNAGLARHAILPNSFSTVKISAHGDAASYAALPEAGMTALAIMREAQLKANDRLAIIGATGGIGLFLCRLASRLGVKVIATVAGVDDDTAVRANGAAETVDYHAGETVALLKQAYPDGVDVVVDLINQLESLFHSATAVRTGGRLISTLLGPDPSAFPPGVSVRYVRLTPIEGDLGQLVGLVGTGELSPVILHRFPFDQVKEAYVALRDEHVRGKVVVSLR